MREQINNENISEGEVSELQSLAKYIEPGDVQLLEWAGIPEFPEDEEQVKARMGKTASIEKKSNDLKKYRISFSGAIDIEALDEEDARERFDQYIERQNQQIIQDVYESAQIEEITEADNINK